MRVTFALVAACVVVRPLLAAPLQDTTQRDGEAKPSTVSVEDFREVAAQYWPVIVGPIAGAAGALAANEFFQRRLDNRAKSERSEDMKTVNGLSDEELDRVCQTYLLVTEAYYRIKHRGPAWTPEHRARCAKRKLAHEALQEHRSGVLPPRLPPGWTYDPATGTLHAPPAPGTSSGGSSNSGSSRRGSGNADAGSGGDQGDRQLFRGALDAGAWRAAITSAVRGVAPSGVRSARSGGAVRRRGPLTLFGGEAAGAGRPGGVVLPALRIPK